VTQANASKAQNPKPYQIKTNELKWQKHPAKTLNFVKPNAGSCGLC
jgi:hypothetical protein